MSKLALVPLALLTTSCEADNQENVTRSEVPQLVTAVQSVSLEFPLHFDSDETPAEYTKVDSAGDKATDKLIYAVVMCSFGMAWFEETSHTYSVMIPSYENAIWNGGGGFHPTDDALITCVKDSARQPFFYRKLPTGIDVHRQ